MLLWLEMAQNKVVFYRHICFLCYSFIDIRLLLYKISVSRIGCHIGGMAVNIFAYADDVVLLAPSWHFI